MYVREGFRYVWQKIIFCDAIIQEKARRVLCSLNQTLPSQEQMFTYFSNDLLSAFKKRNNFKCYKAYGKSANADHAGAESNLPALRRLAATYCAKDIL